jgi:ABC-type transport system involved in cytochrome c biogenesis permease subunit
MITSLLLLLLLIVMGLALLYAYRSQSPSVRMVVYMPVTQEIGGDHLSSSFNPDFCTS